MAKKRILFIYASVGGGHYSVAKAVAAALERQFGDRVDYDMLDIFDERYSPKSLAKMPKLYPKAAKVPELYNFVYRISNGQTRARIVNGLNWLYTKNSIAEGLVDFKPDLIVSTFAFISGPILRELKTAGKTIPFVTVVTDWGEVHTAWYHRGLSYCFVPTEIAAQDALANGIRSDKIEVVGYPTTDDFVPANQAEKIALRQKLGWPADGFTALLMGGSEGMGEIEELTRYIRRHNNDILLIVICGKNSTLHRRISRTIGPPSRVYGFVENIADMMRASDLLISKSGGSTIAEAINTHLPMITYDYALEQEKANVDFITKAGIGLLAGSRRQVSKEIEQLHNNSSKLSEMVQKCAQYSHPEAARNIAQKLVSFL